MKALVLISKLSAGGAERVTVEFMKRLASRGETAHVATVTARHDSALAAELGPAGVTRLDLGASRLADPRALLRLRSLVTRGRYELVHAHGQDASILAAAAHALGGFRLVVTRHVIEEPADDWRQDLRARAALLACRRADALVAVSAAAAERLAALAGLPASRVQVLYNGIDTSRFGRPDVEARRVELRAALGAGDEPLVLLLAVLRAGKGHEVLLEALPRLRERVPGVRALLAGAGEREAELRSLAAPLGDAVIFLGERQDIPELLAACDVVALPSFSEALPTALIEAAAAGRAVVATTVGGTGDVVQDGVTGLLVPPGHPAALADALARVLSERAFAARLGAAGRERARRLFSLDAQVDATLALWREVLARRAPGAARTAGVSAS